MKKLRLKKLNNLLKFKQLISPKLFPEPHASAQCLSMIPGVLSETLVLILTSPHQPFPSLSSFPQVQEQLCNSDLSHRVATLSDYGSGRLPWEDGRR